MRACLKDSLENLFPDADSQCTAIADAGSSGGAAMEVDIARGGTAAVHVLLCDLPRRGVVRLAVRLRGKAVRNAQWYRLIDVPVEVNTGGNGFVEKPGEKPNEFVIRRAPFRTYDAMEPVASPIKADAPTMALRLHVPVAAGEKPGRREYSITVACGDQSADLSLAVDVHRAVIPPADADAIPYTNWFNIDFTAKRHGLKPWSDAHWKMIARYAALMHHARQNTFWIPWGAIFTKRGERLVLDRARLARLVQVFTRAGLYFIEGGHVASRTGGKWDAPTYDVAVSGEMATGMAGNAVLADACGQLMKEIDSHGWRGRWIQHVADEPTEANAIQYRLVAGMVRKYMPGLPIMDATLDTGVVGAVDIWCPIAHRYQRDRATFLAQQALGDRVWFYTCCKPGGAYLNRLLDQELIRPTLLGWATVAFKLDGFLHWGLNWYHENQDPFSQSVVSHGGANCLPAGDTHIVYPGRGGPWSSLRLEAQREGFEDAELLRVLQARRPQSAKVLMAGVIRAMNDYIKDIAKFRQCRRALLQAVSQLG